MQPTLILEKTPKALQSLSQRGRDLSPRQRALLLLANGQRHVREFDALMGQNVVDLVAQLVREGYLRAVDPRAAEPPADDPTGAMPRPRPRPATEAPAAPKEVAADRFGHGRSIAAARMYLFDMAERFFARAQPELALQLRGLFREARDVPELVESAWFLLSHVKAVAGEERAEGIRVRLATMLPEGALDVAAPPLTESS
ncbi:hypothetical protein [Tibeticola sp.]|uniref:hypothetical protein n=1 Tax=Tibeticola sp. TaxID=2005368 RepID=UPI0025F6B394|nr:hypothetical protein [Tibeticola sp.]